MTFSRRARRFVLGGGLFLAIGLAAAPALAADQAVSIVSLSFEPSELTVAQGDKVTWTVTTSVGAPHSVTSGTPDEPNAGSAFDSGSEGLKDDGETFELTIDTPGVYDYFCRVHPVEMTGQVIVLAPGQSAPAVEPPSSEAETGIPVERRLLVGGILVVTLGVCFAGAWLWRRMNPA